MQIGDRVKVKKNRHSNCDGCSIDCTDFTGTIYDADFDEERHPTIYIWWDTPVKKTHKGCDYFKDELEVI